MKDQSAPKGAKELNLDLMFPVKGKIKAYLCVPGLPPTEFRGTFAELCREHSIEVALYGSCAVKLISLRTNEDS